MLQSSQNTQEVCRNDFQTSFKNFNFQKISTFWDQISDPGIFEILDQKNVTVTICIWDMTHLGVAHIFLDHTRSIRYALEMFSAILGKTVCSTNF